MAGSAASQTSHADMPGRMAGRGGSRRVWACTRTGGERRSLWAGFQPPWRAMWNSVPACTDPDGSMLRQASLTSRSLLKFGAAALHAHTSSRSRPAALAAASVRTHPWRSCPGSMYCSASRACSGGVVHASTSQTAKHREADTGGGLRPEVPLHVGTVAGLLQRERPAPGEMAEVGHHWPPIVLRRASHARISDLSRAVSQ